MTKRSESKQHDARPSLSDLIETIKNGIRKRGYYVAAAELLSALWPSDALPEAKIRCLLSFGKEHGWRVSTAEAVDSALFELRDKRGQS
jgi:hypothetical protein